MDGILAWFFEKCDRRKWGMGRQSRDQRSEIREQKPEGRGQRAEGRGRRKSEK
jgi:hypothetical protein